MAQKTRSELISQSNSTFQDGPPANITPTNHRQFNDDSTDSAANLLDSNNFQGNCTFSGAENNFAAGTELIVDSSFTANNGAFVFGTSQFAEGAHRHACLVIDQYATNTYETALTINLQNADGNLIFIEGQDDVNIIDCAIGAIFYATIVDGFLLNPVGLSIQPARPIYLNAGDVLIFVGQAGSQIRILGLYRSGNGQNYFELPTIIDYQTLQFNNALIAGAYYYIPKAVGNYTYPEILWDVLCIANSGNNLAKAYLRNTAIWYNAKINDPFLANGDLQITGVADYVDRQDYNFYANSNVGLPVFDTGSCVFAELSGGVTFRTTIDANVLPISRNVLSVGDNTTAFFGRVLPDAQTANPNFYPHHYSPFQGGNYGNNPDYQSTGITPSIMDDFNDGLNLPNINFSDVTIYYSVINDQCTVSFSLTFETKFVSGPSGQECQVAIPLPFTLAGVQGTGHGSLRFVLEDNHEDIGAIITSGPSQYCVFGAKWRNTLGNQWYPVTCVGSYVYDILPTN